MGFDLSFTNSALFMFLTVLCSSIIFASRNKINLIPNFMQSFNEILYNFIYNLAKQYLKEESERYTPFLMALFMFIAVGNLFGLIPSSFTFTSHLISTFTISMFVFLLCIYVGFKKHGLKLFSLFSPHGVPKLMLPLVFLIEFSLFFVKPILMALRLCVNMIAGHIILKVILHYSTTLFLIKFIPIFGYSVMLLFECAVAVFQAYIFVLLSCISLKDVLYLH